MISRSERLLNYGILLLFAAVALYPVLLILRTALQPDQLGDSGGLHFGNFAEAWDEGHFGSYMRTSVVVAVLVVGLSTTLSVLAGYAFGTMRFRGSEAIFYMMLLGIMIPAEALVVALYFDLRSLGYTDTLLAIVMPQVAQSVAFGTFWMRAYFRSSSRRSWKQRGWTAPATGGRSGASLCRWGGRRSRPWWCSSSCGPGTSSSSPW